MHALLLGAFALLAASTAARAQVVFTADFENGLPAAFGGAGAVEPSQGFSAYGFGASMLRNGTGCPPAATTLTLQNLPPHDALDVDFLLAVIDTWDGLTACCGDDYLTVVVDGQVVFQESFQNSFGGPHPYAAPPGALLVAQTQLGFRMTNVNDLDSAVDLGRDASLSAIPHTASTVTIEWLAAGAGWQHTCAGAALDESWAIDNVRVAVGFAAAASETVRLGAPPNPDALRPGLTSAPLLGATWDPFVDHATFMPTASFDALFVGAAPLNVPVAPLGTALLDPTGAVGVVALAGTPFAIPIPATLALAGTGYPCQAVSLGSNQTVRLTNALDIVVGTF